MWKIWKKFSKKCAKCGYFFKIVENMEKIFKKKCGKCGKIFKKNVENVEIFKKNVQ